MRKPFYRYLALALLALAACGSDPVSYSQPVGIELKAKSGDTVNNVVTNDKEINTESGNPYGAFVTDARTKIGRDPSRITVDHVDLLLGAGSTGVTTLGEIFLGNVDLLFEVSDTNDTFTVGSVAIDAQTAGGPIGVDTTFDTADGTNDADFAKMLNGSFKVVMRGNAAVGFTTKGADANIQATFTFAAFE
jgi:hypothetical protein